jgi:hypothetical protein
VGAAPTSQGLPSAAHSRDLGDVVLATSSLVVWHDHPSGSFPPGDHVFAADLEPATELAAALRADLAETHLVPVAQLRAEPPEPHPLRLTALQAFLARWGARLDERIGSSGVIANTREHGRRRVAALRALGAPTVVVEREAAELARVSSPAWRPTIVPARLVPDVIGAASLVGAGTHPLDGPLAIDADVSDLVLLAAACCVSLDAEEVREPWIDVLADSMAWSSLLDVELADSPIPEGFVRVRPGVYAHEVEALALADTRHVPHAPPTGTLLRVVIPTA